MVVVIGSIGWTETKTGSKLLQNRLNRCNRRHRVSEVSIGQIVNCVLDEQVGFRRVDFEQINAPELPQGREPQVPFRIFCQVAFLHGIDRRNDSCRT